MRKAVVTRADKNIKDMIDISHPLMINYAKRCGADFINIDSDPPFLTDDGKPHYRIIEAKNILSTYDRILIIDTDVIINKDCPDIFNIVPYDCIGSIFEDKGSRAPSRRDLIANIQKEWGDVDWVNGYTNAGFFVMSDIHKSILDSHNGEYWTAWGSGDLHLSYMAHKYNMKFFELEYKWNHMTMFSESWNNHANRFDSYIIHYAGAGTFDRPDRLSQMRYDMEYIYG